MNSKCIFTVCLVAALVVLFSTLSFAAETEPAPSAETTRAPRTVEVIALDGMINVITSEYVLEAVERAEKTVAECLVIEMDTPGGELKSTEAIVKAILGSSVPIVVFVRPSGAQAASAGTFVLMAAHVAAMAPTTRTGAAHPVMMPGGIPMPGQKPDDQEKDESKKSQENILMGKVLNDTIALARGIAEARGRNADWAEKAVRESASIGEKEAVELNVIDLIADDLDDLLQKVDGKSIETETGEKALQTAGARIFRRDMGLRRRILYVISNPNVFYILFLFGVYGIIYELMRPGMIFPGVFGAICLILGFFAMQVLPINWAGAMLILLGIGLLIAEVRIVSYGLLSVGGIGCLMLGSLMLIRRVEGDYLQVIEISWIVILTAVLSTAAVFLIAVGAGIAAQRRKIMTGKEGLVGSIGQVQTRLDPDGTVFLHGEIWRASSEVPLEKGTDIRVVSVDGMTLKVAKAQQSES